jgi:biotin carboxyl carrier protein
MTEALPSWADVLRLVDEIQRAGQPDTVVELPGLRLRVQCGHQPPEPEGLVEVRSPVPGHFYRRPAPDAEPFVELGTAVEEGGTLAIVEVMKLMNQVTAPVAGTVAQICVDGADGGLVEEDQVLFRIAP